MAVSVSRQKGPGVKSLDILVKGLGNKQGSVGWFNSAQYEDGTPVAYVATIQEFGSPQNSIPPRSFMRTTTMEKRNEWGKIIGDGAKGIISGNITPDMVMLGLVTQAKGDIQTKISQIQDPALSDITLGLRKYKLGMVFGMKAGPVTGRTVGIIAAKLRDGTLDTSGVSTKPLIEPSGIPGGGTLLHSIDAKVN